MSDKWTLTSLPPKNFFPLVVLGQDGEKLLSIRGDGAFECPSVEAASEAGERLAAFAKSFSHQAESERAAIVEWLRVQSFEMTSLRHASPSHLADAIERLDHHKEDSKHG